MNFPQMRVQSYFWAISVGTILKNALYILPINFLKFLCIFEIILWEQFHWIVVFQFHEFGLHFVDLLMQGGYFYFELFLGPEQVLKQLSRIKKGVCVLMLIVDEGALELIDERRLRLYVGWVMHWVSSSILI